MIDLYTAEVFFKLDTEMKVERIDYDNAICIGFGIKNKEGQRIHRDFVSLSKPQAKQLRVFLQALE